MTVTNYFTLTTSDESMSKRFRVLLPGYKPGKDKSQSIKKTVDGEYDVAQGGIYRQHDYVIRVKAEEEEEEWGTLSDLDTFWEFNNPNPVSGPSNRLKLTTHYGDEWIVTTVGDFVPEPAGVILEGPDALFFVRVGFLFLGPVEGS